MSPVTHFLTGWVLSCSARLNRRERAAVTLAAVIPDVDGLGVVAEVATRHSPHPLLWFSQYHHALHTALFGVVVTAAVFATVSRRWLVAALTLAAFHLHLLEDVIGSRGPDGYAWPIPYLYPFPSNWSWSGQWQLNAWPNIVLTILLLCVTIWIAMVQGVSPVGIFSPKADRAVVASLRLRFCAEHRE